MYAIVLVKYSNGQREEYVHCQTPQQLSCLRRTLSSDLECSFQIFITETRHATDIAA
jgi:hypothetical protein